MSSKGKLAQVGVRELRQNLSVYLRRVKRGERLEVTEHGRPVALLAPLPQSESTWDRLVAEGRLIPATRDLLDIPAPSGPNLGHAVSDEVLKDREDERF
ncbi:MAG: type II toxin-antitoxin system Phd/YefM family antitoxin [Terriglobales bacterium]